MYSATATDVMNTNVLTLADDLPVHEAARFFLDRDISGAPVVDAAGKVVGVVSLMDIARFETFHEKRIARDLPHDYFVRGWEDVLDQDELRQFHISEESEARVREIMTPAVFSVERDTPVADIASVMISGRIHRVFVLNNDEILGIITSMDLLKLLSAEGVHAAAATTDG